MTQYALGGLQGAHSKRRQVFCRVQEVARGCRPFPARQNKAPSSFLNSLLSHNARASTEQVIKLLRRQQRHDLTRDDEPPQGKDIALVVLCSCCPLRPFSSQHLALLS